MLQSFTLDQFHDQEVHAILVTDVMQRADVRMGEFRNRFGFALQTLPQGRIRGQIAGQNFDGYISLQTSVPGAIHLSHSSRPERRENLVRSEFDTRGKNHRCATL